MDLLIRKKLNIERLSKLKRVLSTANKKTTQSYSEKKSYERSLQITLLNGNLCIITQKVAKTHHTAISAKRKKL